jgi:hypothetical protein
MKVEVEVKGPDLLDSAACQAYPIGSCEDLTSLLSRVSHRALLHISINFLAQDLLLFLKGDVSTCLAWESVPDETCVCVVKPFTTRIRSLKKERIALLGSNWREPPEILLSRNHVVLFSIIPPNELFPELRRATARHSEDTWLHSDG